MHILIFILQGDERQHLKRAFFNTFLELSQHLNEHNALIVICLFFVEELTWKQGQ